MAATASSTKLRPGSILVVETDELTLRAAVCQGGPEGRLRVDAWGLSRQAELSAGLAEAVKQLRSAGHRLPRSAVLLSPQVQSAILHLPVNPSTNLPFAQMQEMVRWELEPYLSQSRARRIGAILVARGYLRWLDLETLLSHLDELGEPDGTPRRLGELAVQFGMITPAQLDECLAIQRDRAELADGQVVCGWTPLNATGRDGQWDWLVCGLPGGYRRQAVAAFRSAGLNLRAIYPLVGCAAAAMNGQLDRGGAVLECHHGYLGYTRFADRCPAAVRVVLSHEPGNPVHAAANAIEPEAETVWLAGRWPDPNSAAEDIAAAIGRSCQMATPQADLPDDIAQPGDLVGLAGAARHYLSADTGIATLACVPAKDPRPSLLANRRLWAAVGSLALTALLVVGALHFRHQASADAETAEVGRAVETRQAELNALRAQCAGMDRSIDFAGRVLPERGRLMGELLTALESACPDGVIIRRLTENAASEIVLSGWGASAQEIQQFKIAIQRQLPRLEVRDGNQPIRQADRARQVSEVSFAFSFELKLVARPATAGGDR